MFRFVRQFVFQHSGGNTAPGLTSSGLTRIGVAAILLLAASLKLYSLGQTASLTSRITVAVVASAELCLAVWLLSGAHLMLSWTVCAICFVIFFQISLFKAIEGQQDCGCFGAAKVNPWLTCSLDLAVLTALLRFWPQRASANSISSGSRARTWSWRLAPLGAIVVAFFVLWRTDAPSARAAINLMDDLSIEQAAFYSATELP